jgi:hypothetical protein
VFGVEQGRVEKTRGCSFAVESVTDRYTAGREVWFQIFEGACARLVISWARGDAPLLQ